MSRATIENGAWTIAHYRGAPIRLHWTIPLGAVVFGRFQFVPGFWLGFVVVILAHELGHALLVARYRLGVTEIMVHGVGGYCQHARAGTRFEEAVIAWGGVLAQLVLLGATLLSRQVLGPPTSGFVGQLTTALIETNLWIVLFNLIPVEPFDGARAWSLLTMLRDRRRNARRERTRADRVSSVVRSDELSREIRPEDNARKVIDDLIERTTRRRG